jgi:hypothetical protein
MRPYRTIVATLLALAGCRAGGSSGAAPQPAPGRAALSVLVQAQPKAGWRDAGSQASAYDIGEIGRSRAFETLNYSALDDIVVWVNATDPPDTAPAPVRITIDIGRPSMAIHPSGLRDSWIIRNSAPEALPIYVLHESGQVSDLGTLAPGAQTSATAREPGLVQLMCDIRPDPLAQIYVAPVPTSGSGRVRVTTSGNRVVFNDLPPGPARVSSWHPRLPGSGADVTLSAGQSANATIVVGVNSLPSVP